MDNYIIDKKKQMALDPIMSLNAALIDDGKHFENLSNLKDLEVEKES